MDDRLIKVAYIDHTAVLSGGEIALVRLLSAIDRKIVNPGVILFSKGELENALKEIDVKCTILPLNSEVLQTKKDDISVGFFGKIKLLVCIISHILKLRTLLLHDRPDIVHTNSLKSDIIAGVAARLCGIKVVWHIRDRISDDYLPSFAVALFRVLARYIPNHLIANSHATLATLCLPAAKNASVVHGGLKFLHMEMPSRCPMDFANPKIGLIGRISPWKGQKEFVMASREVLRRFPEAKFQIVGTALFSEEQYALELRDLIQQHSLENSVELLGFRSDINAVLADLDIFVHASTLPEPFGQTVIEAMAAGCPVIATAAGAIPEILTNEVDGLTVEPGNVQQLAGCIIRLLENPLLAKSFADSAFKKVKEQFNIDLTASKVLQVYEKLIES